MTVVVAVATWVIVGLGPSVGVVVGLSLKATTQAGLMVGIAASGFFWGTVGAIGESLVNLITVSKESKVRDRLTKSIIIISKFFRKFLYIKKINFYNHPFRL